MSKRRLVEKGKCRKATLNETTCRRSMWHAYSHSAEWQGRKLQHWRPSWFFVLGSSTLRILSWFYKHPMPDLDTINQKSVMVKAPTAWKWRPYLGPRYEKFLPSGAQRSALRPQGTYHATRISRIGCQNSHSPWSKSDKSWQNSKFLIIYFSSFTKLGNLT